MEPAAILRYPRPCPCRTHVRTTHAMPLLVSHTNRLRVGGVYGAYKTRSVDSAVAGRFAVRLTEKV